MNRKWLAERASWLKEKDFLEYARMCIIGRSRISERLLQIVDSKQKRIDDLEILVTALSISDADDLTPELKKLYDIEIHKLRLQGVRT